MEADAPPRLSVAHPAEFKFFCRRFVWASNRAGFYAREGYLKSDPRTTPWRPFKRALTGKWQHLYPQLATDLAEKHLDFHRFCRTCAPKSQVRVRDETAFWLGMMAGKQTWADCIDIDSHNVIGWYGLPTQFDPMSRRSYDLDAVRFLPVVHLPLAHFQKLKRFHDAFPGRLWAFSSANLGMGLWKVYRWPRLVVDRYAAVQRQLEAVGLAGTEVYPQPARSKGSLGKCHRRPCGMDSGIITRQAGCEQRPSY